MSEPKALMVKLTNPPRRVIVAKMPDGDYVLHYRILRGYKDIKDTVIKLSPEAVRATVRLLSKLGII